MNEKLDSRGCGEGGGAGGEGEGEGETITDNGRYRTGL